MDSISLSLQMLVLIICSSYYTSSAIVYFDGPILDFIIVIFLSVFIDVNQPNS